MTNNPSIRAAFERDLNPPPVWEQLESWCNAFEDYSKGYQAATSAVMPLLERIVNSDMAQREEDEGNVSPLLDEIRAFLLPTPPSETNEEK